MSFVIPAAYRLLKKEEISEISSTGYILEHIRTKARVFLMENDEENKVFTIGFRTPPEDSTGVAHIIEHSVLCGSRKYPAKDPFIELAKGSLNTFLNAMTYPDKTVYPVASCNDADFANLMSVYMDAVFYPNIHQNEKLFRQEGWHYELESLDGPLIYNGVVYNEMKGAFSSPDDVLERYTGSVLFPDTPYAVESGGDPEEIPSLTYENFKAFHKRYYHPSNSYIYLFGNMDMTERLTWMDEEYLSHFEYLEVHSELPLQNPFSAIARKEVFYAVPPEESLEDATYLSWNKVTDTTLDPIRYMAFQVLEYALLNAEGAPLKQALVDAGIGEDIYGGYANYMRQTHFGVVAKGTNPEKEEAFLSIIRETLENLVKNGMEKRSLEAGVNAMEFKCREADFGSYPKGLIYGLQAFDSWLYDDSAPMMHLAFDHTFKVLRKAVETDYFEKLIQEYLLDNPHGGVVVLKPEQGLTEKRDRALAEKLAAIKAGKTKEELEQIIEETKALKVFQDTPSTKEELEKIPMLTIGEIDKKSRGFSNLQEKAENVVFLHHQYFSNGIAYVKEVYDGGCFTPEELPYLALLNQILGLISTEKYHYRELSDEINIHTGGISTSLQIYPVEKEKALQLKLEVSGKALYDKVHILLALMHEITEKSLYTEGQRLRELVAQIKSRMQAQFQGRSDLVAATRANAYFSNGAALADAKGGIGFYRFVEELDGNFEARKEELLKKLEETAQKIFRREGLLVSITADREGYLLTKEACIPYLQTMRSGEASGFFEMAPLGRRNEGFKTAQQVQYVARCGDYRTGVKDVAYQGAMRVLRVLLSYEYLWTNVRVKGGAYGCSGSFGRGGELQLSSYRDPNLGKTIEVYEGIPGYLRQLELSERDRVKYIIGAISGMDTPLNPAAKGARSLAAYFTGIREEDVQAERDQVLDTDVAALRALADGVENALSDQYLCVIGSSEKIQQEESRFMTVEPLFRR